MANVVYKFKCLRDANNIYIGKTIRHLATRVKEHGTSPAVQNHVKHARQTFHVITFQLLILVKMIMRSLLRRLCIINLKDQLSTNNCLHKGPHLCYVFVLVIGQLCMSMHEEQFKGLVGILSGNTCLCLQMFGSKGVEYSYAVYIR